MHGRRRRGHAALWLTGVAAMLVIGGAAVTAGMIRLQGDDPEAPAAALPEAQTPARKAGQITIDLNPTSGFVAAVRGTDATRQFVTARNFSPSGESGRYAGEVTAFDPGTFDDAALRQGELITVRGHDARFVPDYKFAELSDGGKPYQTPLVGWQDPSGTWVLVYRAPGQRVDRDELESLAASITIAPPKEVRTPFRLGRLPAGLAATYVRSIEDAARRPERSRRAQRTESAGVNRRDVRGAPSGVTVMISATAPRQGVDGREGHADRRHQGRRARRLVRHRAQRAHPRRASAAR